MQEPFRFSEDLTRCTVAELIEIALQLDGPMYNNLPDVWRTPSVRGLAGLCGFCLLADRLRLVLTQCSEEVKAFVAKIDEIAAWALTELKEKGTKAVILKRVLELSEYAGGFERHTYSEEKFTPIREALKEANIECKGQLAYRPSDGLFFLVVDNRFIQIARQAHAAGDFPRAAIGHAHITITETMPPPEAEKWWEILKTRYGVLEHPCFRAKQAEIQYLNHMIDFRVTGAYQGIPKSNSRVASTDQLRVESDALNALAQEGFGFRLKDYHYHITFAEKARAPYAELPTVFVVAEVLGNSPLSQALSQLLRQESASTANVVTVSGPLPEKPLTIDFLVAQYKVIKKIFNHYGINPYIALVENSMHLYIDSEPLSPSEWVAMEKDLNTVCAKYHVVQQWQRFPLAARTAQAQTLSGLYKNYYEQLTKEENSPLKQIDIYTKLGKICNHLGDDNEALAAYEKALEVIRKNSDLKDLAVAELYLRLGKSYFYKNHFRDAKKYFQDALDIYQHHYGDVHSGIAKARMWLANITYKEGNFPRAIEQHKQALNILQLSTTDHHSPPASLAKHYAHMGNAYMGQGHYQQALICQQEALSSAKKACGQKHPTVAWIYTNLGAIYTQQGKDQEALHEQKKALEIRRHLLGEKHPATAKSWNSVGNVYYQLGENKKAIKCFRKAMRITEDRHGQIYSSMAFSHMSLGKTLLQEGNYELALMHFEKALIIDGGANAKSKHAAEDHFQLGNVYLAKGDFLSALQNYRSALAIYQDNREWATHYKRYYYQLVLARTLLQYGLHLKQHQQTEQLSNILKEGLNLITELQYENQCVLEKEHKNFKIYDLLEYDQIINITAQYYVLSDNKMKACTLYLAQAKQWQGDFAPLALRWLNQGTKLLAPNTLYKKELAEFYVLRAEIAMQQGRYRYAINSLDKALALTENSEWQKKRDLWKNSLNQLLSNVDEDFYAQLERAEETYHELQECYLVDLNEKRALSEPAKNRTTELLIKLRNVLDMAFARLVKETVFQPNNVTPGDLYYPFGGSTEGMRNTLYTKSIITPAKVSEKNFVFEVKEAVKALHQVLKEKQYIDADDLLTTKAQQDPDFSELGINFDGYRAQLKAIVEAGTHKKLDRRTLATLDLDGNAKKLRPDVKLVLARLIEKGYIVLHVAPVYEFTTKAKGAPNLPDLEIAFDGYRGALQALMQSGKKLNAETLAKIKADVNVKNAQPDLKLVLKSLMGKKYIECKTGAEYRLTEKSLRLSATEVLDLSEATDDAFLKQQLNVYARLITHAIRTATIEARKHRCLDDAFNEEAYHAILHEQTLWYHKEENNTGNNQAWRCSWLEKLNAIQNESKHVRLTPQGLRAEVRGKKANFNENKVVINIEFMDTRFYGWSFVECLLPLTPEKTDAERIILSRQIVRYLKQDRLGQNGKPCRYIDKQIVRHPLADALVWKIREGKSAAEQEQAKLDFKAQLQRDILQDHPEWEAYIEDLSNELLRKACQKGRVLLIPDLMVEAPQLIETSLKKIWRIVEIFGKVRREEKQRYPDQFSMVGKTPSAEFSRGPMTITLENFLARKVAYEAHGKTYPATLTLSQLDERFTLLRDLAYAFNVLGEPQKAGDLYCELAQQVELEYPWLALHCYRKAFTYSNRTDMKRSTEIAERAAKLAYQHGLAVKALDWLQQACLASVGHPEKYRRLKTLMLKWEEEAKEKCQWLDSDIDSQLTHARETCFEARYLAFRLYRQPENNYLAAKLQNLLIEMIIKLRHILDQALHRFIHGALTKHSYYKNYLINIESIEFPCRSTEDSLREKLIDDILSNAIVKEYDETLQGQDKLLQEIEKNLQSLEAQCKTLKPAEYKKQKSILEAQKIQRQKELRDQFLHPLLTEKEYQKLYHLILKMQPFGKHNEVWLSQLQELSNLTKHVRLILPTQVHLLNSKQHASSIDSFYPICYSEKCLYVWSFKSFLNNDYEFSKEVFNYLLAENSLGEDGKLSDLPKNANEALWKCVKKLLSDEDATADITIAGQQFHERLFAKFPIITFQQSSDIFNYLLHMALKQKGHFDEQRAQWMPVFMILQKSLANITTIFNLLFKQINPIKLSAGAQYPSPEFFGNPRALNRSNGHRQNAAGLAVSHPTSRFFKPEENAQKMFPLQLPDDARPWLEEYGTDPNAGGAPLTRIDDTTLTISVRGTHLAEVTKADVLEDFVGHIKATVGENNYVCHRTDGATLTMQFTNKNITDSLVALLQREGFKLSVPEKQAAMSLT